MALCSPFYDRWKLQSHTPTSMPNGILQYCTMGYRGLLASHSQIKPGIFFPTDKPKIRVSACFTVHYYFWYALGQSQTRTVSNNALWLSLPTRDGQHHSSP